MGATRVYTRKPHAQKNQSIVEVNAYCWWKVSVEQAKPGLTVWLVLLCVWLDWQGIICYELFDLFGDVLSTIGSSEAGNHPEAVRDWSIMFHQNITSIVTRQKLWKLNEEVLKHPSSYNLNLTSSDSYLFLSITNDFAKESLLKLTVPIVCQ